MCAQSTFGSLTGSPDGYTFTLMTNANEWQGLTVTETKTGTVFLVMSVSVYPEGGACARVWNKTTNNNSRIQGKDAADLAAKMAKRFTR